MPEERIKKALYVIARFPDVHITFVVNEMTAIQASGVDVHIASIWPQRPDNEVSEIEKPFLEKHTNLSLTQPIVWLRALQQLVINPFIIPTLITLIRGHILSIYSFMKVFAYIPAGLYLGYVIKRDGYDHLHAHFLTSPTTIALIASKISGVPFTNTSHAFDIFSTSPQLINGAKQFKLESAKNNIMISQYNKRWLQEKYPNMQANFTVIYNGIDISKFVPDPARGDGYGDPVQVITNGRLIDKKGHAYLIRAIAQLRHDDYNVHLSIIGTGELEDALKQLVSELGMTKHIEFLGKMPYEDVIRRYHACDIFALTCAVGADGDMDGLPTVLIEALALEIPSISTQITGVPEIIRHGETGWCVPPHDVPSIVAAFKEAIDHPDDARRRGIAGRKLVEAQFDRRKNALKVYEAWH